MADQAHVLLPVPVAARIGMATGPAAGAGTAWYLIMANHVFAVSGDLVFLAGPRREPRRGVVHPPAKGVRVVCVTSVLDADAVLVRSPPTGVPGDVLVLHTLRH